MYYRLTKPSESSIPSVFLREFTAKASEFLNNFKLKNSPD